MVDDKTTHCKLAYTRCMVQKHGPLAAVGQNMPDMSSSDRLTRKNSPLKSNIESLADIQPKLYRFERLPAPPHALMEQPNSAVGGGTHTIFVVDVVAIDWPYCFRFLDFLRIME